MILILPSLIFITFGCNADAPVKVRSQTDEVYTDASLIKPDKGMSGIVGKVVNASDVWPGRMIFVFAAEYYGSSTKEGVYILETSLVPKALLDENLIFVLNNISPKEYILLIGPNPEASIPIKENGLPKVFEVESDEVLNIGSIENFP